jgi:alpha-tubulin suppressor-like RCC1 family protein
VSGQVYGWGGVKVERLDLENYENYEDRATLMEIDCDNPVKMVVAGQFHGVALTNYGRMYGGGG